MNDGNQKSDYNIFVNIISLSLGDELQKFLYHTLMKGHPLVKLNSGINKCQATYSLKWLQQHTHGVLRSAMHI